MTMGRALTTVVMVVAAVLMMALAACTTRGVDQALERSTAPVLVPQGEWRDGFEFTAPPGSTDLYQLRWNFRVGVSDLVLGWQVAPTSEYDQTRLGEGPGQDLVDEVLLAATDDCPDVADGVRFCTYSNELARDGVNAYLVRSIGDHTLVLEYLNPAGDRTVFDPDVPTARYVLADFDAIPVDEATDDYLVYIY